jgi:serine/threonine protein phosphatase PrpC
VGILKFGKGKPKNPPDGSTESKETDIGDETTPAQPSASSEPDEPTETAEQPVNSVEAQAQPDAVAQSTATPQAQPETRIRAAESLAWHGPFEGRYPVYRIIINHDHHGQGAGEDAPPLWRPGLVGAFDGLGGAGGELVKLEDDTEQTGAWLASRAVREEVRDVYDRNVKPRSAPRAPQDPNFDGDVAPVPKPYQEFDFTVEIRRAIQGRLDSYARRIRTTGGASKLKSKLIKTLPTTLAVCLYDVDKDQFTAIWAGDSRIFYLRPEAGLLQVTTDDLRTHADALKNLTEDSPMSNYVSAESDFVLRVRDHDLQPFSILLAATDGCFGYVQTPLHFEHLLLSTMQEATDWADWQSRLETGIIRVTSDDSTLAAAIIGWRDFADCRDRFRERAVWCQARVRAYDDAHDLVRRLDQKLDQARLDLAETTSTLWEEYRRTYETPVGTPTRNVTEHQQAERHEPGPAGAGPSPGADRP